MKKIFILATMIACIGVCASTTMYGQKVKSTVKKTAVVKNIKKAIGFVGEGTTMHFLEVKTIGSKSETMNFTINDATNTRNANLVIGNIVEVFYKVVNGNNVAVKVEGSKDYVNALGKWTVPDPINKKKRMGVQLDINGVAKSINMATLPYSSWELLGKKGKLLLHGKSIGNGQSFDVCDTVYIYKAKKRWVMENPSNKTYYYKTK